MSEKRAHQRRRVLKAGKILFANGACTLDCTIKNITEGGAMLQVGHSVGVPDDFQLYEPGRLMLHEARVVRRAGNIIGVAITASKDISESVDPRFKRLRTMV